MGTDTKIAWCDHTFNPWIGCTPVSAGCANCYAARDDARRHWTPEGWGKGKPRKRTSEAYWKQPFRWDRKARERGIRPRVFCGSLMDCFDAEIPNEWRHEAIQVMRRTQHLDWLLLTKRPAEMRNYVECHAMPPNIWLGVTAENQATADERIPILLSTPAAVRFVSYEPATEAVDFSRFFDARVNRGPCWLIVGGESGPKARPFDVAWAKSTIQQCRLTGASCFVKQLGARPYAVEGSEAACLWMPNGRDGIGLMDDCGGIHLRDKSHGADPSEWPEDLRVREFPREP